MSPAHFPGWRTMTGAQRRNARMRKLFDAAKPGAKFDAGWDTGDPLSEQEQTRRGQLLADTLQLRKSRAALGLYRTVKRIIEQGE